MLPPNDFKALAEFSTIPPNVPPAELAVRLILPSNVCTVVDEAKVIFFVAIRPIPDPENVEVRPTFTLMSPPYAVIGPAAVMPVVENPTVWSLVVLPIVKPVIV